MNKVPTLTQPLCARNAGVGMLLSILSSFLIYISLDTLFKVPRESTIAVARIISTNALSVIILIFFILIFGFFNLMASAASFNVLKTVNRDLAKLSSISRIMEVLFFIISIILLFLGLSFFVYVFVIGKIFYAFHIFFIGILVFRSHFLNKYVGISLVIGGSIGYLIEGLIYFFATDFVWFSSFGLFVAFTSEIALGITLILKALQVINERPDPKNTVITILKALGGEATTSEIIDQTSDETCKDRIPNTLVTLEKEKELTKMVSKEKKAIIWRLTY